MNKTWVIAKRELASFFDSLMAYILLVLFLGISGLFTWITGSDVFFINQAGLQAFFSVSYWSLFFFIPAITMKMLAEENRNGTIELLLTRPISDWQIIFGKFLATLLLIVIALAFTIPYYITVANIGTVDHGAIISGYLGLILMSAAYISIGIFSSSISKNQIVGFLMALSIGILFHIIFGVLSSVFHGTMSSLFDYMSVSSHFDSMARGVIDTKDIIYFLSIVFVGLVSTEFVLMKKRM
jgi:ABC-2 type transport system permease protein